MHRFTVTPFPGIVFAWSWEWPGLICSAPDMAALRGRFPLALAEYAAWLARNGETPDADDWRIEETIEPGAGATSGDPAYACDLAPLNDAEFERYLRHAEFAQEDLLRAAALPDALLDWDPEGLVVENADPWAREPRTIREILIHALQLDIFYRESLTDGVAPGIFERVDSPESEHAATLDRLRLSAADGRDRVWQPTRYGQPDPGTWTLRKAFRRLISHNRAHTFEIHERTWWAIHGVPTGHSATGRSQPGR